MILYVEYVRGACGTRYTLRRRLKNISLIFFLRVLLGCCSAVCALAGNFPDNIDPRIRGGEPLLSVEVNGGFVGRKPEMGVGDVKFICKFLPLWVLFLMGSYMYDAFFACSVRTDTFYVSDDCGGYRCCAMCLRHRRLSDARLDQPLSGER